MPIIYDAAEKVRSQYYSFEFMINDEPYHMWYDPDRHDEVCDCDGDTAQCLDELVYAIAMLVYNQAEACGFHPDDLYKFVYKHLKASLKVEKELAKGYAKDEA